MGGWGELYPIFFGIFGFFLTLQSPYTKEDVLMSPNNSHISGTAIGHGISNCLASTVDAIT